MSWLGSNTFADETSGLACNGYSPQLGVACACWNDGSNILYYSAIIGGVSACKFPPVPVDYGYRDSTNFWCSSFRRPFSVKIKAHEGDVKSVIYCAERIDPEIKFTTEACAKLTKIPRVFLKAALTQMADIAKECEIKVIDEQALEIINQKRKARRK